MKKRPEQREAFIASYLRHFNAARAAREAGFEPKNAGRHGWQLLREPEVREAVNEALGKRIEKQKTEVDEVLNRWLAIARADPNELMQLRRVCCRYCHGKDGRRQRTQGERDKEYAQWARDRAAYEKVGLDLSTGDFQDFDEQGGIGYNATREPVAECFECFGDGVESTYFADTREVSPDARALFAGVKTTKDGIEVKVHSQEKAWEYIARYLGMLKEKVEVEATVGLVERLARGRARAKQQRDDGSDLAG